MTKTADHNRATNFPIPSFSIILETENLATTAPEGLLLALDSLSQQELPITEATEVLMLNSGDVPADILTMIAHRYPWVRIVQIDDGLGYYGAKLKGALSVAGDIVVFADSDCVYSSTWLRSLVEPFCSDKIHIVAGETMISGAGPYSLANHFTFFFDGFSHARFLYPAKTYHANNFACRRSLLECYPIPDGLSLYRGNCVLHRAELTRNGITIWGQPDARAHHAPPLPKDFVWRYLLIGRDKVLLTRLIRDCNVTLPKKRMTEKLYARLVSICRYYPAKLLWLPVAVPIGLVATSLILAGYWVTKTKAGLLIGLHESLEQKAGEI